MVNPVQGEKYPSVGSYEPDHNNLLRRMISNLGIIMQGKLNNTGEITLGAAATSTEVNLSKGQLSPKTVITFMPRTANASAEIGAGTIYVSLNAKAVSSSSISAFSFKINHANNAQTDRRFRFLLMG